MEKRYEALNQFAELLFSQVSLSLSLALTRTLSLLISLSLYLLPQSLSLAHTHALSPSRHGEAIRGAQPVHRAPPFPGPLPRQSVKGGKFIQNRLRRRF